MQLAALWPLTAMLASRPLGMGSLCTALAMLAAAVRPGGGASWTDVCAQASYCGAAPPAADSYKELPGLRLRAVAMVARHGDRTPLGRGTEDGPIPCWSMLVDPDQCVFLPPGLRAAFSPTQPGMLTFGGRRQLVALGEALNLIYGPRLGLERVRVESTGYPRTFLSARALLEGLVPDQLVNISIVGHATLPSPSPSPAPTMGGRGDEPLLWTLTRSLPSSAECPRLQEIQQRLQDQPPYEELRRRVSELMSTVSRGPSFGEINDDLLCRACHGFALPSPLRAAPPSATPPAQLATSLCLLNRHVHNWWREASLRDAELVRLQVGHALGRVFAFLAKGDGDGERAVKRRGPGRSHDDNQRTFYVLAAHDTTLTQLLIALGANSISDWPPYAAHLIIELWEPVVPGLGGEGEGLRVRLLYNGKVVSPSWCGGEGGGAQACPWNGLIEYVKGILLHTEDEYQEACRPREGTIPRS